MNNTLDIKRFGKVLKHDGINFFPNIFLSLAILWAIPVVIYLFTILMPGVERDILDAFPRFVLISILKSIAIIIVPARLYKHCNDSRKGIGYIMLPASTLEKFLSMVIFCTIVIPVIYIAGALAIDSILALFNGPYFGFAATLFFDINKTGINDIIIASGNTGMIVAQQLLNTLILSSIFMYGNMIFKKRKTGKMIIILILLFIIFMIILINYAVHNQDILNRIITESDHEYLIKFIMRIIFFFNIIVSALLLWGTYHRLKTQKY